MPFSIVVVFISFKAFNQYSTMTWNVMYWVLILFISTNAVLKSFVQEKGGASLYYYQLLDPSLVIVSKIIYNFFFLFVLGILTLLLFIYFSFNPIQDLGVFFGNLALVSLGLSIVFSFVGAIASGEKNASVLSAILGLPMVLPILLMGIKISSIALAITSDSNIGGDFILLMAIDGLLFGLVILLFPILWKS